MGMSVAWMAITPFIGIGPAQLPTASGGPVAWIRFAVAARRTRAA